MSPPPTPLPPEPSWDDLHALAAGELDPAAARTLRERAVTEPDLARRIERAERLEQRLLGGDLLEVPADLARRIVAALPSSSPWARLPLLVRAAAAVLLALGAWLATTGSPPTLAEARTPPALERAFASTWSAVDAPALELPRRPIAAEQLGVDAGWVQGTVGLLVLGAGLAFARRRLARPAVHEENPS